jgi:polyferredoxin
LEHARWPNTKGRRRRRKSKRKRRKKRKMRRRRRRRMVASHFLTQILLNIAVQIPTFRDHFHDIIPCFNHARKLLILYFQANTGKIH